MEPTGQASTRRGERSPGPMDEQTRPGRRRRLRTQSLVILLAGGVACGDATGPPHDDARQGPADLRLIADRLESHFDGKHWVCEFRLTARLEGGEPLRWTGGYEWTVAEGDTALEAPISREGVVSLFGGLGLAPGAVAQRDSMAAHFKDPFVRTYRFDFVSAGDSLSEHVSVDCWTGA